MPIGAATKVRTEESLRYTIERYPNQDRIGIHIDDRLPRIFEFRLDRKDGWLSNVKLSAGDTDFFSEIGGIPGVVTLTAQDYCLTIEKGRVFSWDEIVPGAIELLRARYAPEDQAELVASIPTEVEG
jgi:hypothetical protein